MIELPTRPSFDVKVCWVIALEPEARPIIDELDLRRYAHNLNFPVYFNPENGHALVISGIDNLLILSPTREDWTGDPPGELIIKATALGFPFLKALSSVEASALSEIPPRDPDEMRPVRRTRDTVFRRFNFFKKGIFSMSNV